jgi:hypothetical protein
MPPVPVVDGVLRLGSFFLLLLFFPSALLSHLTFFEIRRPTLFCSSLFSARESLQQWRYVESMLALCLVLEPGGAGPWMGWRRGGRGGGDGACLSLSSFLCDQERARQAASPPPPPFRPLLPAPVFHLLLGRGGTRVFPVLPDATSEKGQEQQGQGQSDDEGDITKRRRRRRRPPPMVSRSSLFSLVLSLLLWLPLELLLGAFGEKMTYSFLEQQPRRVPRSGREPPPRDVTRLPSRFD